MMLKTCLQSAHTQIARLPLPSQRLLLKQNQPHPLKWTQHKGRLLPCPMGPRPLYPTALPPLHPPATSWECPRPARTCPGRGFRVCSPWWRPKGPLMHPCLLHMGSLTTRTSIHTKTPRLRALPQPPTLLPICPRPPHLTLLQATTPATLLHPHACHQGTVCLLRAWASPPLGTLLRPANLRCRCPPTPCRPWQEWTEGRGWDERWWNQFFTPRIHVPVYSIYLLYQVYVYSVAGFTGRYRHFSCQVEHWWNLSVREDVNYNRLPLGFRVSPFGETSSPLLRIKGIVHLKITLMLF